MRENGLMPNRAWCMDTLRTSTKTRLGTWPKACIGSSVTLVVEATGIEPVSENPSI